MTQLSDDCFAFGGKLMTTAEALALLHDRLTTVAEAEAVPLHQAGGRVLAADIVSRHNVPPRDNSAVDGYALAFADLAADKETPLDVVARIPAGQAPDLRHRPGQAVRIFTGAVLPDGFDTVVMQEDVDVDGDTVTVPPGLKPGSNARKAGEDITEGAVVLRTGHRLRAQDLGLAASIGLQALTVYRPLRVALFSTGDELREPGADLPPGAIYDANRYMLAGLIEGLGCQVTDLGILPDKLDAVRTALAGAATDHDVLFTSGGVSTGEEDHVRAAVESLGVIHAWRLAIKPGRPIALGQVKGTAFVGLPGNPVAAMVCFLKFARPLILQLGGCTDDTARTYKVRAGFNHKKKPDRREWIRAHIAVNGDGQTEARKFRSQGSGILSSMVESDGLVELPEDLTELRAGDLIDFLPFSEVNV
jgi:molybdopterin molybdotransferase